jgi:hypothetical protein
LVQALEPVLAQEQARETVSATAQALSSWFRYPGLLS